MEKEFKGQESILVKNHDSHTITPSLPPTPSSFSICLLFPSGVSSPSVDFLRSKDKLTVGQCQSGRSFTSPSLRQGG